MENYQNNIHPFARIIFLLGSLATTFMLGDISLLLGFYSLFIFPLIFILQLTKVHIRLFIFGIVPIFLTFSLLYIFVMKSELGGWGFVFFRCIKILNYTSVFQISLSIPSSMLLLTFKKWGFKGDSLLTLIGAFTVWADIKTRANQIITARFARGFIGKRNYLNTIKQFPHVLIPLVIGVIRTSTVRVEVWEQYNITELLDNERLIKMKYPVLINSVIVVVPLGILFLIVLKTF